jgi:diguanylate cyclase (GGDEF)-like protein
MEPLHPFYERYLDVLDIAFQPIVDIHSGEVFGVEALLRETDTLGYATIHSFFDHLYHKNILYTFDIALREKVIRKFSTLSFAPTIKLFYNLDNRILNMGDYARGNTARILKNYNMDHKSIIFEISEHDEISDFTQFASLMQHYRNEGYCIAIDDFGIGQSGYKMLYNTKPNILKIDRFFIDNIHNDSKKKLLVRQMTQLATLMGCRVVAEGIETYEEFLVCKEVGCHLAQGYFIQKPTCDSAALSAHYPQINQTTFVEKRVSKDQAILQKRLEPLTAIAIGSSTETLLEMFSQHPELFLIPVVDMQGSPLGIIHEHRLKSIIYSPFGQSLIKNNSTNFSTLETYIDVIPVVDIKASLETIVELFSLHENASGVLVVDSSKYIGYLSARILIEAVHERNLIRARDQNPLSRLPGNFMITEYIASAFTSGCHYAFCYFDFDHFKPYNDHYGFRSGDRVIVLFADLMHKIFLNEYFIGHIGGDDFFAASFIKNDEAFELFCSRVHDIIVRFTRDVREFYNDEDKARGSIMAHDREGNKKEFDLLTVSAVIVYKGEESSVTTPEQLQKIFAIEKKNAKHSPEHLRTIID